VTRPNAVDPTRPKRSWADIALSAVLIAVSILFAIVGWFGIWIEVGLRTASDGPAPLPLCAVDAAPVFGFPFAALAAVLGGIVLTIVTVRRRGPARYAGGLTLLTILLLLAISAVVPLADQSGLCAR
jgi:hypothetical protein